MLSAKVPRVCLMIGQLGLGGTEKQLALLAAGLRERGLGVSVLVMFDGGPYERAVRAAGVPVVRLGFRRRADGWRMPGGNVAAFARLAGLLRRGRPDVLHAFLFHAYVTAAPAARLSGVPVMVAARRSLGGFKRGRPLALAAEAAATRLADHLVANAAAVARDARREPGTRRGMISVIPNGLAPDAFDDVPAATIDTRLPVVLCVANLIAYKGHRDLLDAMAVLRARGTPCTLALAGDGPERPALEARAARLGVDVRFLGARDDVPALLSRADVVTLASLEEGMSNAVMEAMAAGRPIVATAVGGTPELLGGQWPAPAAGRHAGTLGCGAGVGDVWPSAEGWWPARVAGRHGGTFGCGAGVGDVWPSAEGWWPARVAGRHGGTLGRGPGVGDVGSSVGGQWPVRAAGRHGGALGCGDAWPLADGWWPAPAAGRHPRTFGGGAAPGDVRARAGDRAAAPASGSAVWITDRGILVPPGDAAALADGLGRALGDVGRAVRLGERAREWSRAHLSVEAMVERHVELYTGLLERARRRRACAG